MSREYIGYVVISVEMEQKLSSKHGVSAEEVRDACQAPNRYRVAWWHVDDLHGRRLLVLGTTRTGRRLKIILRPVDSLDGTWKLRTAFESTS